MSAQQGGSGTFLQTHPRYLYFFNTKRISRSLTRRLQEPLGSTNRSGGEQMPISLSEAVQTLLSGDALSWAKFGDHRPGSIQLASPGARRLLHHLLSCNRAKVAQGNEELFDGVIAAWRNTSFDPAQTTKPIKRAPHSGKWRLVRFESAGFGGLNLVDGPNFVLPVDGENWCLEGQNGSGKTSLVSAIIWALTGYRCRDQEGLIFDDGRRVPVFNDSGIQIGDWPPLIAYPATPSKLRGTAEAWVRLNFQNENGNTATAYRRLCAPVASEPIFQEKIDPVLLSTPQLVETGLLMPARLSRIGFGDRSQSIYEAVKLLTGLDQLADVGEGAASLTHKAKRFLKYSLDNGADAIATRMELSLERATEAALKAGFDLKISGKREDEAFAEELRKIADRASTEAGAHLNVLASDIASSLNTNNPEDRFKIKYAVSTARGVLQQGVKGIPEFDAWTALKAAHTDAMFQKLPGEIAEARRKVNEAIAWDRRQAEDTKLRLKALAAKFFVLPDHPHSDPECPLCESRLTGERRKALAAELAELKEASASAERRLTDVCAELESNLRTLVSPGIQAHFGMLSRMQPRESFEAAAVGRFVQEAPFSTVLTGMGDFAKVTAKKLAAQLPVFATDEPKAPSHIPAAAAHLVGYIGDLERISSLVVWWSRNRQSFVESWTVLKGSPDGDKQPQRDSMEGRLASLESALEKTSPLDDIAKALNYTAAQAESWLLIHKHQIMREEIAEALQPLKDLRVLVANETASSISALSGRMKSVLDRIHFKERLSFEDASLNKKSVQISGSFDHGIRVDASTVANSSWLRAILWAFVLALREQTLEALGENPFALTVLDDPQNTFDPRNKRKWAEEIARLANAAPSELEEMQLVVITHERQFFQLLVNVEKLSGQQGLVVCLNAASKVATVVNGTSLARSYEEATAKGNDELGHRYVFEIRTYCEDLLKIMLRAEGPDVCNLSLDKLAALMKKLRESSVAPVNRPSFGKLLNTIAGGGGAKPMKIINESHHKFDGTIGVAQAMDVKAFWENTLQTQIHTCFKVYAEYEVYCGEPRLFPWMDNVIPFPPGNATDVKRLNLLHTGIAAAAKSDGRVGDGLITIEELNEATKVTLHNHDAYQLASGTLDPVATVGDVIIVSNYAKVHARNLVIAAFGDQLLARRYNDVEIHPHIAILTGQSTDPYALAQPVIVPREKIAPRKIVGTLFTRSKLPTPPNDANVEFVTLNDLSVVNMLLQDSKLFRVSGRSAEPIALDGQLIMTRAVRFTPAALGEMDGRLSIAVDDDGARYFKRFRRHGTLIVLESLNPDGTTPAEILSLDGELGLPRLVGLLEVVGVLFELPE